MKRITGLLTMLAFSLVIIWTSAGVAMLHCAHTGALSPLVTASSCSSSCCKESTAMAAHHRNAGHTEKTAHCHPVSPCMSVQVMKLSPSTLSHSIHLIFSQAPTACLLPAWTQSLLPMPKARPAERDFALLLRHGPPRSYLAFLRILRI